MWKIPETVITIIDNEEYKVTNMKIINSFGDYALYSFLKIMIKIKLSPSLNLVIKNYLNSSKLSSNLSVIERLPGY